MQTKPSDTSHIVFELSDDQHYQLRKALEKSKKLAPIVDCINKNTEGNALSRIVELFNNNISSEDIR